MTEVSIYDWALVEVMVVQSLVGAIPANLRKVELVHQSEHWLLRATFSSESQAEIDEFSDVIDDLSIYMGDLVGIIEKDAMKDFVLETVCTDIKLDFHEDINTRIVFQRKED